MGLRIANNIAAMNAQRWLQTNDTALSKSLERLSSGYRINNAADDAAGLAISQGFRADIASFKVASRNTSEASSLLSVAEGGMDQIGNMLTRLKELATQSASANVGSTERAKINSEGNALISEIDRIAQGTKYGDTTLLDGTFGASNTGTAGTNTADQGMIGTTWNSYLFTESANTILANATVTAMDSDVEEGTYYLGRVASGTETLVISDTATGGTIQEQAVFTSGAVSAGGTAVFANLGITMTFTGTLTTMESVTTQTLLSTVALARTGLSSLNVEGATTGTYTFDTGDANKLTLGNGTVTETVDYVANSTHTFTQLGISLYLSGATEGYDDNDLEAKTITVSSSGSTGSTFQVGAENNTNNQMSFTISSVRAEGSSGLGLSYDMMDTVAEAQSMIALVDTAVSTLSTRRGDIGAAQNRLGYAGANLATTIENMQAAESVIRDVDMASEMTSFTKNQILLQAGTAMLAQANMAPQQVLALFG